MSDEKQSKPKMNIWSDILIVLIGCSFVCAICYMALNSTRQKAADTATAQEPIAQASPSASVEPLPGGN